MKNPTQDAIAAWGGIFPPAIFGEIDAFLADEKFSYLGVCQDGRLKWVCLCNEQLDLRLVLIVEVKYVIDSEVAFDTSLIVDSGRVAVQLSKLSQSGVDPAGELSYHVSKGVTGIAAFNLSHYDSELHEDGFYRVIKYQLGNCKPALSSWIKQYQRTIAPLMGQLCDPHKLIKLLESSPSLPRYRMGDKAWCSTAPQLFSALIYFELGMLNKALACTKQRHSELLEHQMRELTLAENYFQAKQ